MSDPRAPSLRRLLGVLLAVMGLLVALLFVVTSLQLRGSQRQADAENRRTHSFLLADSMRQSSNDLTNTVRLYVATGNPRFRRHYDEILAIRNGDAPRPRDYDSSFWDRVMARGTRDVDYGPPRSLVDLMREADFSEREFQALNASLNASNRLAELELDVMERVERRIGRGVDEAYLDDVSADLARLVDPSYLAEKAAIMAAIERFVDLVEDRTRGEVADVRAGNDELIAAQVIILALMVLVGVAAMVRVSRAVVRPLGSLAAATRRFAGGDYGERAEIRSVAELEQVAGAFNEMAAAIEADIGARERAEQAAVEANHAKSRFLAAMSHEIRTPMIGVTGMLEVLARTELSPQQRHMVATAEHSAHSLLQIIGDVLDFSKIEASKLELAPTTIDLRGLVEAAVATFRHTASAKGLLLTSAVDSAVAPAHVADQLRLRQIVVNFLSNAVKFTSVGGIEVGARVLEDRGGEQTVELSVVDTGPGVSAEQQHELFSDFAQADAATAQQHGGTGLGLAICRRLARLMGGDVTMQSVPARGTTMRLVVPLPVGDPADIDPLAARLVEPVAATRAKPTREQARAEGSLLLVAEDHAVNRAVLRHQLDIVGFEADFAEDGVEALDLFLEGGYALVVTDLHMPNLDGYGLAGAIRRYEAEIGAPRVPVVALSANVMQGEPERCRAAGMDDFMAKPTTIPFLAAKLRAWLPDLAWQDAAPAASEGGLVDGVLDLAALAEVTGGDMGLATTLIEDFAESSRQDLDELDDALASDDPAVVQRQAHRIKGAARIVGATHVVALARELEDAAAGATATAPLAALAEGLRAALEACREATRSMT